MKKLSHPSKTILMFLLVLVVSILGWVCADFLSFSDIGLLYNNLLSATAAIFTIIGLWFGVVYPNLLRSIFKKDADVDLSTANTQARSLLDPIFLSLIIFAFAIIFKPISLVIMNVDLSSQVMSIIKRIFVVLGAILYLILIKVIMSAIHATDWLKSRVSDHVAKEKEKDDRAKLTQKL